MDIIEQFEEVRGHDFEAAFKELSNVYSVNALRDLMRSQVKDEYFTKALFEWLFKCIQFKDKSEELFTFILQFSPDLLLVYLHAVYENNVKLKAMTEAPLLGLLMETEKDKVSPIQVPSLTKPSIYHKSTVQLPQSGLTEANLLRHNQTEAQPRPTFSGMTITVNNRLLFLSTVMNLFADHITKFCHETKIAFCECCIIVGVQGMGSFFTSNLPTISANLNIEELSGMRRYSVSDSLVSSLLRGLRMCLFKSCHSVTMNALLVLKLRSEYELLTNSIQISYALSRLSENVKPQEIVLDSQKQMCYHGAGVPKFQNDPTIVHSVFNSHVLHCELTSHSENTGSPVDRELAANGLRVSQSTDV